MKGAKIIPDKDYDEFEAKKPDALIVKKPLVIAAIEYKVPSQLRTEKQIEKAISQELGTAQALQAKVYIITDGKKSIWVNPANGHEILQEDGSKITLNFDKTSAECILLINKIRASINATNDTLKAAASVDPLPLAEKIWQDLWAVSGATPENCLYTFVEVFIFKYLSDLGVLKGMYSFYDLLSKYSGNNENEVLEFYASTIRVKIKELFPGNPKDKTTIINGTIFVSKDDKAVSGYATVFHKILKRFNDFGTLENIDNVRRYECFVWSNHKYLVFQAPVLILLYITALIEITAVGSGKIRSVIDNGRPLALEKLIEFQVCLCIDRISQKLGEESTEQGFSVNLDILFFKVTGNIPEGRFRLGIHLKHQLHILSGFGVCHHLLCADTFNHCRLQLITVWGLPAHMKSIYPLSLCF